MQAITYNYSISGRVIFRVGKARSRCWRSVGLHEKAMLQRKEKAAQVNQEADWRIQIIVGDSFHSRVKLGVRSRRQRAEASECTYNTNNPHAPTEITKQVRAPSRGILRERVHQSLYGLSHHTASSVNTSTKVYMAYLIRRQTRQ